MKKKLCFLSLILLLSVSVLQASIVLPPFIAYLFTKYSMNSWLSFLVPLGFLIEWYCIHQFIGKNFRESFFATLVVNVVSTILGFFPAQFDVFATVTWFVGRLFTYEQLAIFSVGTIPGAYVVNIVLLGLAAVVVNVIIESGVILALYKIKDKRRMLRWVIIANILSSGIGFVGFATHVHRFAEGAARSRERMEKVLRSRSS